ncbi:hypothetical protein ACQY0O_006936 [Thecaphora frezii]
MLVDTKSCGTVASPDHEPVENRPAEAKAPHQFTIPKIVITRAPERPRYSEPIPEQTYDKAVLFVPVKTEELNWDNGGLYWNGTFAYPVHNIYNKEGDAIGRRRNGPQGYRFAEMFEAHTPPLPAFEGAEENDVESAHGRRSADSTRSACRKVAPSEQEAKVNLEEPAPLPLPPSDNSDETEVLNSTDVASNIHCDDEDDGDIADDAASLSGESEAPSLWSHRGSSDSVSTTPGHATPCVNEITPANGVASTESGLDASLLFRKLEAESGRDVEDKHTPNQAVDAVIAPGETEEHRRPSTKANRIAQGWTHLGSIPRRRPLNHLEKQRACTLPDSGKDWYGFSKSLSLNTALDASRKHRSVSVPASPVLDDKTSSAALAESPPTSPSMPAVDVHPMEQAPRRQRRASSNRGGNSGSSSSLFCSIADDLTHSVFPANAKVAQKPSRRSSMSTTKPASRQRRCYNEFAFDSDYSAGWAFEQGTSSLCNDWQLS